MPKLTDTAVRNFKFVDKQYKRPDGQGLYLLVTAAGKYFRYDYRHSGKRKTLALGVYPDISLSEARAGLEAARKQLRDGVDPAAQRRAQRLHGSESAANTYEVIAREWYAVKAKGWAKSHAGKIIRRQEQYMFPWIGQHAIADIAPMDVLAALRRVEKAGLGETAHRALQASSRIFNYAIQTGRATQNPAAALKGALEPIEESHFAAVVDPAQVGALLRAIREYKGSLVTARALRFGALTFVRPGELRHAEWNEINVEEARWTIPAAKMKSRREHIVPLSTQCLEILEELRPFTGKSRYIFPGIRDRKRPLSDGTINAALRNLGYTADIMTGHGFRAMASTLLNEHGWPSDAIERQLAHRAGNKIRAIYDRSELLPERREIMQWWADYLDHLAEGKNPPPQTKPRRQRAADP